ncbi:MAG TPA: tRNA pseudouridine(55) synthase TruB [Gemmatimonadaceae bacterium]|nr:tRNA pseudouridine(55) synthase TruB [Gemmatimonadaceae bacterium]
MGRTAHEGLLLVDKPAGMTSHDVVDRARHALRERRVGHAGTLDPFATGLLVLLVGKATRLISFIPGEPKVYEATIRFGSATDTDDLTGAVVSEAPLPDRAAVERGMLALTGVIEQRPPAYSAKQVGGTRAYTAARRGAPLDLAPVRVRVDSWRLRAWRGEECDVTIVCGGGTYVRALARDLGELSGSAAHLVALRRTASGPFSVSDAAAVAELSAEALRPALDALPDLERRVLAEGAASRVAHGNPIPAESASARVALLAPDGALLALAERDADEWRPRVVFADA